MVPKITFVDQAPGERIFRFDQTICSSAGYRFFLPLRGTKHNIRLRLNKAGPLAEIILQSLDRHWSTGSLVAIQPKELFVPLNSRFDFEREAEELYADILEVILLCFQGDEDWQEYWTKKAEEALEQGLGCGVCVRGKYRRSLDSDSEGCPNCYSDVDPDFYWNLLKEQRREKGLPCKADRGW